MSLEKNINLTGAVRPCPAMETGFFAGRPDRETLSSFTDREKVRKLVEERVKMSRHPHILPVCQNMESLVYGSRLADEGEIWIPGDYCVKSLKDIENFEFDLLSHPLIRTVIELIPYYKDKELILEAEAPFTILAALMDPIDLYPCFSEDPNRLKSILFRIARASAEYLRQCVEAGAKVISLADPVGTLDMVGGEYFREFSGAAALCLMDRCRTFTDYALIHLCPRLSWSFEEAGMISSRPSPDRGEEEGFMDVLYAMARDPEIHFSGMACIHHPESFNDKISSLVIK